MSDWMDDQGPVGAMHRELVSIRSEGKWMTLNGTQGTTGGELVKSADTISKCLTQLFGEAPAGDATTDMFEETDRWVRLTEVVYDFQTMIKKFKADDTLINWNHKAHAKELDEIMTRLNDVAENG